MATTPSGKGGGGRSYDVEFARQATPVGSLRGAQRLAGNVSKAMARYGAKSKAPEILGGAGAPSGNPAYSAKWPNGQPVAVVNAKATKAAISKLLGASKLVT